MRLSNLIIQPHFANSLKNVKSEEDVKDAKQKRAVANEIMQGYRDWYNIG